VTNETGFVFHQDGNDWVAENGGTTVRVDGQHGWLKSFQVAGRELLASPLRPNFWRVPTDNDNGWKVPQKMGVWKDAVAQARLQSLASETTSTGPRITAKLQLPVSNSTAQISYALLTNGTLRVELELEPGAKTPELPRFGMQFAIPRELAHVRWFGRGPQENYWDRKSGAAVGLFASTVSEWITPYVRPQENANRCDVRWIGFTAPDGTGLQIKSVRSPFGVSAWPYSTADLATASHDHQLPQRDFITVNVDGNQMGVGGDNSWGLPVHNEYRLQRSYDLDLVFELQSLRPPKHESH